MTNTKNSHWWKLNRKVVMSVWRELDVQWRDIIASDTEGMHEITVWFKAHTEVETNRLFEDPEFYYNLKESFQYES